VFQELMDLIAKSNSMSTAELSQMKAELKLKQKVKKYSCFVVVVVVVVTVVSHFL